MGSVDTTLRLLLTGEDRSASKALKGVGWQAGQTSAGMKKMGTLAKGAAIGMIGALVGVGVAAVDFGKDSLKAFADAEKSQAMLDDAWKRFPKTADTNIEALRKYNQALQRKTGADADDVAAGQASLAMYNLTGQQIKDTTPLLVDYATKTGKDMPTAAKTMGKALLGNTKALKDMGISYKSTGDPAKDYANIMGLLKEKVGGYAESVPDAEKKSKILAASFGDLQEKVGEKLQPAMLALVDAGQGVLDWLERNPEMVEGVSTAFGALGNMMRWFWNNILLPVVKFWIHSNAEVVKGLGLILEATGRMTGNKDLENFGKGIQTAATATQEWADGLKAIPDEVSPKVDARTEAAKKKVVELDGKIKSLKDRVVTAKAKGDDKELTALRRKLAKLEREKFAAKITVGVTMNRDKDEVVYNMAGQGHVKFTARRRGGPIRAGQPYWVGEDGPEPFFPNVSGHMLSNMQARSAAIMAGSGSMGSAGGGGEVHHYHHVQIDGNVDDLTTGRNVIKAVNAAVVSAGGKGVTVREGWRR